MNSASGMCWRAASGPRRNRLRVTGRLLDAETGAVLWSQAYDDDLRRPRLLRDPGRRGTEGRDRHRPALRHHLPVGREAHPGAERRRTWRPMPARCGSTAIAPPWAQPATPRSGRALKRAVARYPSYATAWAMLSMLYLDEDRFGFNPRPGSPTATQRAIEAARLGQPSRSGERPRVAGADDGALLHGAAGGGAAGRRAGGGAQPERHRTARRIRKPRGPGRRPQAWHGPHGAGPCP